MESIRVGPALRRYHDNKSGATNLAGKYRLIAELGQGGMATVYLAVAVGSGGFRRLAVVKVLRPEMAVDEEFVQMFLDEAKLCARLAHPNIVHTYDVGGDDIGHLIAMEYLDGVSLHAAIGRLGRARNQLTFPMQARVLLDVLEGLRYAHGLSDYDGTPLHIVHRDVTPHNIFVTYEGQVKLLDFGIAKAATSSVRTATGVVKGKLTYMAPEQARGDPVDARTDLFSVGVMLWEAITGRRRLPTGLSEPALFSKLIMGELPESPEAASHGWPAEADAVAMKALAPKPDDRYQTAAEFYDALEKVLRLVPPVSLRDLGAMLAEAFAKSRLGVRNIIEEQFKTLEEGAPASIPAMLPAIPRNAGGTDSFTLSAVEDPPADVREMPTQVTVSSSKSGPGHSVPIVRKTKVAILASLGVFLLGVATVLAMNFRQIQHPVPAVEVRQPAVVPSSSPPVQAAHAATSGEAVANAETPPGPGAAAAADSASRPNVRGRPTPGLPPRIRPPNATASGAETGSRPARADPAPSETGSNTTSTDPPSSTATPLHKPDGKPKVQLERENPWQ